MENCFVRHQHGIASPRHRSHPANLLPGRMHFFLASAPHRPCRAVGCGDRKTVLGMRMERWIRILGPSVPKRKQQKSKDKL